MADMDYIVRYDNYLELVHELNESSFSLLEFATHAR